MAPVARVEFLRVQDRRARRRRRIGARPKRAMSGTRSLLTIRLYTTSRSSASACARATRSCGDRCRRSSCARAGRRDRCTELRRSAFAEHGPHAGRRLLRCRFAFPWQAKPRCTWMRARPAAAEVAGRRAMEVMRLGRLQRPVEAVVGAQPRIIGCIGTLVAREDGDACGHPLAAFIDDVERDSRAGQEEAARRGSDRAARAADGLDQHERRVAAFVADRGDAPHRATSGPAQVEIAEGERQGRAPLVVVSHSWCASRPR